MKILHIFSDWKWTGPSEPILNLCSGLIKSDDIVHLACLQTPTSDSSGRNLPDKAKELGIKTLLLSPLPKYFPFLAMRQNIKKLAGYISEHGFDIIHCHSSMDHFYAVAILAGLPSPLERPVMSSLGKLLFSPLLLYFLTGQAYRVRRHHLPTPMLRQASKNIKIIRTNHKGFPLELSYSNKFLLKYATDGYIALSKNLAEIDCKNFSLEPEKIVSIGGAVDIKPSAGGETSPKGGQIIPNGEAQVESHRDPEVRPKKATSFGTQIKSGDNLRSELGIKKDDIVIGVVARVQRHRRFNIIIEAMRLVAKEMPSVKLLIIGRGTHYDELVTRPVKELNLGDNVISAGYRSSKTLSHPRLTLPFGQVQPVRSEDNGDGNELRERSISGTLDTSNGARKDDYFDIINILDFGVYLVPGSDGSCRAALELMASGKPLIVARRGVLPEIVDDNQSGLVIDDTPENLAQAILHLAKDKELLNRFSQQARLKMTNEFSPELSVKATTDFYHRIATKTRRHEGHNPLFYSPFVKGD